MGTTLFDETGHIMTIASPFQASLISMDKWTTGDNVCRVEGGEVCDEDQWVSLYLLLSGPGPGLLLRYELSRITLKWIFRLARKCKAPLSLC